MVCGKEGMVLSDCGEGLPPPVTGCAPSTPALPFDCNAGCANRMVEWSVAKKAWCYQTARGALRTGRRAGGFGGACSEGEREGERERERGLPSRAYGSPL